jgi:hypothetical protein
VVEVFEAIWRDKKLWSLIPKAYELYRQYLDDSRKFKRIDIPHVPFFVVGPAAAGVEVTGKTLPEFPDVLFTDRKDLDRIFSIDPNTENRLRALYHDPQSQGFKVEVDKILSEKYGGAPPAVPAPSAAAVQFGFFPDEYLGAVEEMFDASKSKPLKGSSLNEGVYKYVLFGHTHDAKQKRLDDLGVTYFNTGTWTAKVDVDGNNRSKLCYVTVQKNADNAVTADQDFWPV